MPRTVTTGLYDFDPLMQNPDNRVVNEKQVLAVPGRDDFHFLIPQAAPFFVTSMVVRNETTNETYVEGVDFVFGHWFVEAMERTGRSTAGSIRFLRRNIAGIIVFDYHTLGGQWGFDDQSILRELSQRSLNPLVRAWAQIDVLPALFPPVPHDQVVDNLVGWEHVVEAVGGVADAITAANEGSNVSHIDSRDNPHEVTKVQVQLGNVDNFPTVSDAEARAANRADRFMTPRGTRLAFEQHVLPVIQAHLDDEDNPHKTTKLQVGLGLVENYPVATKEEAEGLLVGNRYITPERLGEALNYWYSETLASFFDGGGNNPTGVTKAQVGLGSVENYRVATDTEAVQGTRNDLYMTPLRTYQLVDAFARIPLGQHIADELNPHNVTASQVGLGNVLNYRVATRIEAQNGNSHTTYMTPLRTAEAIQTLVGSEITEFANDFVQINDALDGKLDIDGTAADTTLAYGKTESDLMSDVRNQTVNNALNFDGNSYSAMLAEVKAQTVDNAERLGGLTSNELRSSFEQFVFDNASNFASVNYTTLNIAYFSENSIAPISTRNIDAAVTGLFFIETTEGFSSLFVTADGINPPYLNVLSGMMPEVVFHRNEEESEETWYIESNTTIFSIGFLDLGNSSISFVSSSEHFEDGPFTIPSGADTLPMNDIKTTATVKLDQLEQAFQDAADELAA